MQNPDSVADRALSALGRVTRVDSGVAGLYILNKHIFFSIYFSIINFRYNGKAYVKDC